MIGCLFFTILSIAGITSGFCMAGSVTQIFILHSYSDEYPWTKGQHEGFMAALREDPELNPSISTEFLDTKRRAYNDAYSEETVRHFSIKYKDYQPDAIYVTDDNALLFARDYLVRVFPGAPVFFSGINNYEVLSSLDPSVFTGVFEKKEISPNLDFVLSMDSKVIHLIFIGDQSNTYKAIESEIKKDLTPYPLKASFISEKRLDKALQRLEGLAGRYVFLTTLGEMTDESGQVLPLGRIIKPIAATGRLVISMEDAYIMEGVLGGHVTSGKEQGSSAGRLFLSYHHGRPVSGLPAVLKSPNVYIFDDQVRQRFGLTLPETVREKAVILNPLPGFYEKNRFLILSSLVSLAILFLIFFFAAMLILTRKNRELDAARKIAESANSLFRELAQQSRTIHWESDGKGVYTHVSEVAFSVLGYQPEELIGKYRFYDFIGQNSLEKKAEGSCGYFCRKEPFHDLEQAARTKNGRAVFLLSHGVPVFGNNGAFLGYRGSDSDITERKESERKRETLEIQNRQLQKTESLSRMAGAIAHHFNNQLAAVIGNLELVKLSEDHREISRLVHEATSATYSAARLSSLMLTYLGQSSAGKKVLDLSEVLSRSLPVMQAALSKEISLNADFQLPGPSFHGNEDEIRQAVSNLVTNAREAYGQKGEIRIHIRQTLAGKDIPTSRCYPHGWKPLPDRPYACLEISDTGCGMSEKEMDLVFDPFYSTKFPGRGLGLPVALGIIKAHSGGIALRSELNKGSTFLVFLPLV